jgi:hypothetical protein
VTGQAPRHLRIDAERGGLDHPTTLCADCCTDSRRFLPLDDDLAERKNVQELYRLLVECLKANGFQELCERAAHDQASESAITPLIAVLPGGRVLTVDISSVTPPGEGIKVWISTLDVYGRADRAAYGDPIHQAIRSSVDVESVMEVIRTVTR